MSRRKRKKKRPAPPEPAPASTTPLQKLLLAGFGLALFAAGLAAAELLLALFGVGDARLYDDPFVGFESTRELFMEARRDDGTRVYTTSPGKLEFFNHQEFPAEKADGVVRVFTLGGSTTFGRPYDADVAFGRWLELYLNAADPSRRFEVVNAGAISYASYRVVVLMKELVRYEPDVFVIYTGHNEFLEERTYSDLIHANPAWRRLRVRMSGLRTATLMRGVLEGRRREPAGDAPTTLLESEVTTRLESWTGLAAYHKDDELRRSVVEHFEFNLRQMVRIARDHGVEVIFVLPVSNLKDFSPFKSELAVSTEEEAAEDFHRRLAAGRAELDAGRTEAALRTFRQLLEVDPEYAELHFRLGRALFARGDYEAGDYEAARAAFVRARDLDVAPLRALESIVRKIRDVAAEEAVPAIDLPALLEARNVERFGHPILGNEVFLDHVHPDIPVHSLIAERLVDVLAERRDASWNPPIVPLRGNEARRRELYDTVVGAIDRRYYAERDLNLAKVLGWSGKLEEAEPPLLRAAEILTGRFEVHLNLGIVYQKTGRFEAALTQLRRAVELGPDSPEAHFNLGVTHGQLGQVEAGIAELEEAIRLRADYPEARYDLEVLRRHLDDAREAGRWNDRGILLAGRGELDAARQALERAIELDPDWADAHFNLGVVHDQSGDARRAIVAIERALELDPENARYRQALALVLEAAGRQ